MTNKKYRAFEILIYYILLFLAFVLQTTGLLFKHNSPAPSMIVAVFVSVIFFENYWFSAIFGLVSGSLLDAINVNGVGFYALVFLIAGSICGFIIGRYLQNNFASFAVLGFPVILILNFADVIIKSGFTSGIFNLYFRFNLIIAIYTFAVSFILYLIFYFIIKKDERFIKPKGVLKSK